jgi:hypothetical protein
MKLQGGQSAPKKSSSATPETAPNAPDIIQIEIEADHSPGSPIATLCFLGGSEPAPDDRDW